MTRPKTRRGRPLAVQTRLLALAAALAAATAVAAATAPPAPARLTLGEREVEWSGDVEHLSWSPRAFVLRGFLSDAECDHIIAAAEPLMRASKVLDVETGERKQSDVRTSTGTIMGRGYDEVVRRIERRIAQATMVPVEHQEGLQVLHYRDGQKYEAHYDYFHDPVNSALENGGQRLLTLLMYLSTPEEGGETVFPDAPEAARVTGPGWSDCARRGLAHKPKRGDALLFYSLTPDGTKDPLSIHGSCPTIKGDKWSATKWVHVAPMRPPRPSDFDGGAAAGSGGQQQQQKKPAVVIDVPVKQA